MKQTSELIEELSKFPLLEALFGRRSRRFGLGMEIPDGPLAYRSQHEALPLSDLERTLLVLCGAGISGWSTGIEYSRSGQADTGCNYPLRLVGRTFATGAGVHSSELIFTDDSGTYITQFRDLDPQKWREFGEAADLDGMMERVRAHCTKLRDDRATVPAEPPHTGAHNIWNANRPGSTLFAPVVDLTEHMLDVLAIYVGMGNAPYDPLQQRYCGDLEPFFRSGLLVRERRLSLTDFEQHMVASAAMEAMQMCHNMMLLMQGMGLGGWMLTGINPLSLMGAHAGQGIPGFGFRFARDERWMAPNPVGIDGSMEGLCPPYQPDMRTAVKIFVERKFGAGGTYDPNRPGPYRDSAAVKARVDRYAPELVAVLEEVASYIYDTYGKFPGTTMTMYMRPYVQAHHLDIDFYDEFYGPDSCLDTHRQHMHRWHP
jgi:hypothetical protein